ncbi:unnamed protein product [Rotaria sp. Silwood1]|nr:unnamed protein product [Rotaria sp. Silwood1]CAF1572069.1 unnamed protein product [Rotaria sp. Silwood1]CAF3657707.1 unnamed protein product [Rotaria sp. Silwood1]CAF3671974.1 unnamed protein product [Rotaria sp. Silwood1]CAF3698393.1 unnamed protein product [Rotaria sp. Silwood1]
MSDTPPQKPKIPHMSHLQSEPIPMSFASPQFLAQVTAGTANLFPNSQMKTTSQAYMPMASSGYDKMHATFQPQSASQINKNSNAASSSASSSDTKLLKPLPPQPIDAATFKGFKFVTLDGLQVETREVYDKISGTFQWEMCESQDERCINFIRNECENKRVFLVSSGGLGQKVVPEVHDLPQVYAIYIYCANVKFHESWAKKYAKVRVVCDNDDLYLLPQFAVDVAQANIDWGNGLLQQGTRDKAKEKFKLASDKLNNYARNHDPAMDVEIQNKLEECK